MGMNFIQRENGGTLRAALMCSIFTDIHHVFSYLFILQKRIYSDCNYEIVQFT